MRKNKKRLLLTLELLIVLSLLGGVFLFQRQIKERDTASLSAAEQSRRFMPSISWQGQSYPLRRNMNALLLIGTDTSEEQAKQAVSDRYFFNRSLADFLVVLVFDNVNKTVTPFQICRDTMCEVSRVNISGQPIDSAVMQITLAHSYGKGGTDSAVNTRNTVENLLFQIPIDHYLRFTMDAVPLLNDLVGGVTVTLPNDIPSLGAEFVAGNVVLLKGQTALRFVRYRDKEQLDSNLQRMANHRAYIEGFTTAARTAAEKDGDLAVKIFRQLEPFLCTDLSVENVQSIVDRLVEYEILPVVTPDGYYAYMEGELYPGFYVDEESLFSCVRTVFCQ